MGINGLLTLARNAITPLAESRAATLGAEAQANRENIALAFRRAQLDRELQMDKMRESLLRAQTGAAESLSRMRDSENGEYKQGADGEYYWLPRRRPSINGDHSAASPDAEPDGDVPTSGQQTPTSLGIPTGVLGPTKPPPHTQITTGSVGNHTMRGTVGPGGTFSPMTTASGDTVFAPPRSAGHADAGSTTQITHVLANLRGQISETNQRLSAARREVAAGRDPFATPETKAGAAAAQQRADDLAARLDSLQSVHDRMSAQQQRMSGLDAAPPNAIAQSLRRAPAPPSYRLEPKADQQMRAAFDAASSDLQAILDSDAPATVKAQARALYDAHQREIAQRYGTGQAGTP